MFLRQLEIYLVRSFSSGAICNKSKGGSSSSWMKRHVSDPYVINSVKDNYRARSAYKLLEINKSAKIIRRGDTVVECGAAPGAWTQVATRGVTLNIDQKNKKSQIIAHFILM